MASHTGGPKSKRWSVISFLPRIVAPMVGMVACVALCALGMALEFTVGQCAMLVFSGGLFFLWGCTCLGCELGPLTESVGLRCFLGFCFVLLMVFFFSTWTELPGSRLEWLPERPVGFIVVFAPGLPFLIRTLLDLS